MFYEMITSKYFLQKEYDDEGIRWQHIQFIDNQETLNMLAEKPMNIMALVDEESRFPRSVSCTS